MRQIVFISLALLAVLTAASPGGGDNKRRLSVLENLKFPMGSSSSSSHNNHQRREVQPTAASCHSQRDSIHGASASSAASVDPQELEKLKQQSSKLDMLKNFVLLMKLKDKFNRDRSPSPTKEKNFDEQSQQQANSAVVQPAYFNGPLNYGPSPLGPPTGPWGSPYGPQVGPPPCGISGPMPGCNCNCGPNCNCNCCPAPRYYQCPQNHPIQPHPHTYGQHWNPNQYPCMPGGISGSGPTSAFGSGSLPNGARGIRGGMYDDDTNSQMGMQQSCSGAPLRGQPCRGSSNGERRSSSNKFMDAMSSILFNNGTEKDTLTVDGNESIGGGGNSRRNSMSKQIINMFSKAVHTVVYDQSVNLKEILNRENPLDLAMKQLRAGSILFCLLLNPITNL